MHELKFEFIDELLSYKSEGRKAHHQLWKLWSLLAVLSILTKKNWTIIQVAHNWAYLFNRWILEYRA